MLKTALSNDGVFSITLANPPANALSEAMIERLTNEIETLDEAARVIVIGHEGKLFSAGHDIKEMTARRSDPDNGRAFFEMVMGKCANLMQAVVHAKVPVIAKVDGLATAAGCQLVASCDLAYATSGSRFCTPGVNIGLFCSTPMVALSRNVHRKHAMEMLLVGEELPAEKAVEFGLINEIVDVESLDARVESVAQTIASKSKYVLEIGKRAFYEQAEMSLSNAYDHCAAVMVRNMMARDAEEGLGAILEKRTPVWSDS